jgi:PncC family amidohydrolase
MLAAMTDVQRVAAYLQRKGLRVATAESCTAGLIAATLADVPGAGELLDSAYVTYSPQAKQRCLGVRDATLARCNLTSEPVAREMALGALREARVDVAIANTGVTDAVDPDVPAGTQCFAWAVRRPGRRPRVFVETVRFQGGRNAIRLAAARYALSRLPDYVRQAQRKS